MYIHMYLYVYVRLTIGVRLLDQLGQRPIVPAEAVRGVVGVAVLGDEQDPLLDALTGASGTRQTHLCRDAALIGRP